MRFNDVQIIPRQREHHWMGRDSISNYGYGGGGGGMSPVIHNFLYDSAQKESFQSLRSRKLMILKLMILKLFVCVRDVGITYLKGYSHLHGGVTVNHALESTLT